ncbi:DNA-processing protein DprA [Paractinoplanes globisporus]|uniref:DNA-processing protein DprA n=1 Tax=Paractinoplanes globisporus TaxID=113565 RepID=A0ABW6WNA2_9ACTN|nr:DNA-processing protein DprA [Actinoplanes globisporus]
MNNPRTYPDESLTLAVSAFVDPRTPARIFSVLKHEGRDGLKRRFAALPEQARTDVLAKAEELSGKGIYAVLLGDPGYPRQLGPLASSSPVFFCWGNPELFGAPGIGMCGSRKATELGLKAAGLCGEEAAASGITVVSGYAKGVDTETHLAALNSGGTTVIVLPEGIDGFRIKRDFPRELFRKENVLVVSQFAPRQPWTAGAAMTRNKVIYGLGSALVVIEAGERGGTLAAGEGALSSGRPVLVLDFDGSTPPGNRILLDKGGIPVPNRRRLQEVIRSLPPPRTDRADNEQLDLLGKG